MSTPMSVPESVPGQRLRPARPEDLDHIVRLHMSFLPHGLFPRLGPRFMRRWHRTFLTGDHGIAVVVEDNGAFGFLVGAAHQRAHVRQIIDRERVSLGVRGLTALVLRPRVLAHFMRTRGMRYGRRILGPRVPAPRVRELPADVAVITALVVDPAQRCHGAGAALVASFETEAHRRGARRAELVTLADEDGASTFYRSLGWSVLQTRTTKDGDRVLLMTKDLVHPRSGTQEQASHRAGEGR